MKIAVVSDTHNNWETFKKAIEWIKKEKIQKVFHCGDINSQQIIDDAKKLFDAEIYFSKGNADWELNLPDKIEVELEGRKIGIVHFPAEAKKMSQSGKFDVVFYGHTHRAWDELVLSEVEGKNCHMINPGELAGQFYKPTFAIYDTATGSLELKILEKL